MKNVFINPDTGLLRAGFRLIVFAVVFALITTIGMVTVRTINGGLPKLSLLQFATLGVTATLAVFVARRFLDKKSFVSLGLKLDGTAAADTLIGIVISALVMAGMFSLLLSLGLIEFHGLSWWGDDTGGQFQATAVLAIGAVVAKLTIVAWWEELVMRGYVFRNLIAGVGLAWAIALSSLLFGFTHGLNPNATLLTSVLIAVITPQLIYAYLKTGQLWLPIGLHLGWNFFQASVFGFAASGQDSPSLIRQSPVGPEWLSGGAFGAEGSILIVPATALSCLIIHYWVRFTRKSQEPVFAIAHGM